MMSNSFTIPGADGAVIRCTRYPAKHEVRAVIIIAHGYKGFKDWGMFPYVAQQLSSIGDVITFNFSHNGIGEQPEEFTELELFAHNTYGFELEDLSNVTNYIKEQPEYQELPLFVLGHSRGGGTSLIHALDHPDQIAGVLSWNGISDLPSLFTTEQKKEMVTTGRSYITNARTGQQMPLDRSIIDDIEQHREQYDLLHRITEAALPIMLVQGTEDHPHLLEGSQALLNANPSINYVAIEGGNHMFNTVHPFADSSPQLDQAIEASSTFIRSVIGSRLD